MQIYKNVVSPCFPQENPETLIIDIVPPPELHLFKHIVTQVNDVLMAEEFTKNYLLSKTVTSYGYNGGGYNGPNCHKIMSCLNELREICPPNVIPSIETLRKFRTGINKSSAKSYSIQGWKLFYSSYSIRVGNSTLYKHIMLLLLKGNKDLWVFLVNKPLILYTKP